MKKRQTTMIAIINAATIKVPISACCSVSGGRGFQGKPARPIIIRLRSERWRREAYSSYQAKESLGSHRPLRRNKKQTSMITIINPAPANPPGSARGTVPDGMGMRGKAAIAIMIYSAVEEAKTGDRTS
jgi:hypothetical protein